MADFVGGGWQNGEMPFKGIVSQWRDKLREDREGDNAGHAKRTSGNAQAQQRWQQNVVHNHFYGQNPAGPVNPAAAGTGAPATATAPSKPRAPRKRSTGPSLALRTAIATEQTAANTAGLHPMANPHQFPGYHPTPSGLLVP